MINCLMRSFNLDINAELLFRYVTCNFRLTLIYMYIIKELKRCRRWCAIIYYEWREVHWLPMPRARIQLLFYCVQYYNHYYDASAFRKIHISVQTFITLLPNERTHTLNDVCDPSVSAFIIYFHAQSSALQRKLDRTERTNRAPPLRTVIILIAQFRHRRMFNRSALGWPWSYCVEKYNIFDIYHSILNYLQFAYTQKKNMI